MPEEKMSVMLANIIPARDPGDGLRSVYQACRSGAFQVREGEGHCLHDQVSPCRPWRWSFIQDINYVCLSRFK